MPGPADFIDPIATLAAKGVTGLVDFEFADSFVDWPLRPGRRAAAGVVYPHQLEQVIAAGLRTGDPLPGTGGLATMAPLKVITDGSLGTRTAWTHEPYSDGPATPDNPCGVANYSVAELRRVHPLGHRRRPRWSTARDRGSRQHAAGRLRRRRWARLGGACAAGHPG